METQSICGHWCGFADRVRRFVLFVFFVAIYGGSGDGAAGGEGGFGGEEGDALFERAFAGGEEHALGEFAAHGAGFEVGDDDDEFADQIGGSVVIFEGGADLSGFAGGEFDLEDEELVGVGMLAAFEDSGDAQVETGEVVEFDERLLRGDGAGVFHGFPVMKGDVGIIVAAGTGEVHGGTDREKLEKLGRVVQFGRDGSDCSMGSTGEEMGAADWQLAA